MHTDDFYTPLLARLLERQQDAIGPMRVLFDRCDRHQLPPQLAIGFEHPIELGLINLPTRENVEVSRMRVL